MHFKTSGSEKDTYSGKGIVPTNFPLEKLKAQYLKVIAKNFGGHPG